MGVLCGVLARLFWRIKVGDRFLKSRAYLIVYCNFLKVRHYMIKRIIEKLNGLTKTMITFLRRE